MHPLVANVLEHVRNEGLLDRETALQLADPAVDQDDLLYAANKVRKHFRGQQVHFCSIVNARSGSCSEDCKFCAQSSHYQTDAPVYDLLSPGEVREAAQQAKANGARCFGVVTSGLGVRDSDLDTICELYASLRDLGLRLGGSLGIMNPEQARRLREAGMDMCNHNLETSRRHFPKVVQSHGYQARLNTLQYAREAGMVLCSGGIFGMGEDWEDRVDMLADLQALRVESVPLNFLNPIPGTPFENLETLHPQEILRGIAIARLMLPWAEVRICGGREGNMRDLQSWMFHAGASGALIGHYLTTMGRAASDDQQMVSDLGLESGRGDCGCPSPAPGMTCGEGMN